MVGFLERLDRERVKLVFHREPHLDVLDPDPAFPFAKGAIEFYVVGCIPEQRLGEGFPDVLELALPVALLDVNVALANEPLQLGYIDIQRLRHSGRAPLILEQIGALGLVPVERDAEDDPPGWRRTEDSLHRRLQAGSEVLAFPRPFHAFGLRELGEIVVHVVGDDDRLDPGRPGPQGADELLPQPTLFAGAHR